jgi:2-polyprenyl-6-methoxyphenol hydroxylase-like FAD-dependent oxidoreductase
VAAPNHEAVSILSLSAPMAEAKGMGPKIVIIGGGIAGLTAAVAMARKGLDAEIYEQASELKEVGAGVGLWGNAFRALRAIGLADEVVRLAGEPAGSGVKRPDGAWLLYQPYEIMQKRWGAGFASVHRAELHRLLADQLDPSAIHLDARCTGISEAGNVVQARFADGREVEADILVGADGAHSVVRPTLLGPSPIRYRGYTTVGALTPAGSVPLPRDGSETWGRGIRFGVAPTSGERVVWYAVWKAPAGETGVSTEHLIRLFGSWHKPVRAVIEATPPDTTVRKDVYDRMPGRTWTRGRVALIGDAIHLMTPDLGQGACQAMVDAVTLADCLAQPGNLGAALVSYQRRRWRNAAFTTLLARTFGNMGQLDRQLTCGARNALVRAMPLSLQLRQLDLVVGQPPTSQSARPRT